MKTCVFKNKETFPVYPVTIGAYVNQRDINRPLGINIHQIFIVSDGVGVLETGNDIKALRKGDMFLLEKGMGHAYRGEDNFKTTYLGFDGDLCESLFNYFGVKNGEVFRAKDYEPIEMLIAEFLNEFDIVGNSAILSAKSYSIVTRFFYEARKNKITPIEQVKNYLESNFGKQLNLDDIMQFYPYSKSKLCRDFLLEYGTSIFEMLTKIRLNHARIMLKSVPGIQIKDVAGNCGFNDVSYFCKMYKKMFGVSPKKSVLN